MDSALKITGIKTFIVPPRWLFVKIETDDNLPNDRFIPIDPAGTQTTKLRSLVAALQAVKVPNADIIEIIKGLDRNGKLHGRLIVE